MKPRSEDVPSMIQRLFQDLPDSQLSPCVYLVSVVVTGVVKVVADAEKLFVLH